MKKYKILIIEASKIVTSGLREIFESQPEFEVIHSYSGLNQYIERSAALHPDFLLVNPAQMDYQKRLSVRSVLPGIKPVPILVAISYSYQEAETLKQYDTVIEITDDTPTIIKKLKQAIENNNLKDDLIESYELSERENEILTSVAKGMTNKEIADQYNISIHTVISHRKNITRKTGIKTVSGLTVYALLNNLISQSDIE